MRLIDADELYKELSEKGKEFYEDKLFDSCYAIKCSKVIVCMSPTVDAEPVKHGHWIVKKTATGATYTVCSYCNTSVKYNDEYGTGVLNLKGAPRCPNCGAKMDEEEIE